MDRKNSKKKLASRISIHTNVRTDIVEEILDGFIDIVVEDVVNKGEFVLTELFTITSKEWKSSTYEKKPHRRLVIKISHRINELWKMRHNIFNGSTEVINRNNWKQIYYDNAKRYDKNSTEVLDENNPFLSDDDE